ncbi:unnamed protein product [Lota lota]
MLISEGVKAWICILLSKVVVGRGTHCTTATNATTTTRQRQPDLKSHPLAAPAKLQCGRTETEDSGATEHHDTD